MITLNILGGEPYLDPRILDVSDVPIILFAILCLFTAYYKTKKVKHLESKENVLLDSNDEFQFKSYDILMQPKKDYADLKPLTNFSISRKATKEIILVIVLIVFYYLIFTEKI